jgi:nucleoside-diphosphate-sugar epimerase
VVFVTGASGLVGSHLVEQLAAAGRRIRCLVRASSDTSLLAPLGVELVAGDVTDPPETLRKAIGEAEVVFHCAGMVDDWASREAMIRVNVDGVRNMLEACAGLPTLRRFVMVDSMVVFGMGPQIDLDETAPLVHTGDNYNYTKILACELALKYAREKGVPVVLCRPPYIYGPRDRQFFPRVFESIRDKQFKFIGDGNNPITLVYVLNLVRSLILASQADLKPGEVFLVTDGESITRRELVEMICHEVGCPVPRTQVAIPVARIGMPIVELIAKLRGTRPIINRFKWKFMVTPLTFDISKARRVLGYEPLEPPRESLRKTIQWYAEHHPEMLPKG